MSDAYNQPPDGGEAFPSFTEDGISRSGMSLRDYFANGPISDREFDMLRDNYFAVNKTPVVSVATLRYYRADNMLEARKK